MEGKCGDWVGVEKGSGKNVEKSKFCEGAVEKEF